MLWWTVLLCNTQTSSKLLYLFKLACGVIPSLFVFLTVYLAETVVVAEPYSGTAFHSVWTQGRHSFPSFVGWGWKGAARMFQSLPAHYMPQIAAFLSPLISCMDSHTHSLSPEPPFLTVIFPLDVLKSCCFFYFLSAPFSALCFREKPCVLKGDYCL